MKSIIEIDGRQWISAPAAARRVGISNVAVRQWSRAGVLPPMKRIGLRVWFFDKSAFDAALANLTTQ
jgi:predicted site-specific integrase-resolvase